MLESYAVRRSDTTVYISITDAICHRDVSPGNDAIDGVYARPSGIHYEGAGVDEAVQVILDRMTNALYPGP